MYQSDCGTIQAVIADLSAELFTGGDFAGFTHEMMHQSLPCPVFSGDAGTVEGLASGKGDLVYLTARALNPLLFPANGPQPTATCATGVDMYNNRKLTVWGGANYQGNSNFYGNLDNEFQSPCSLWALLMNKLGGDYRQFDHAINQNLPATRAQFLALADSFGKKIDGVNPSTFLGYDVPALLPLPTVCILASDRWAETTQVM